MRPAQLGFFGAFLLLVGALPAGAETEIKIGYMKHPVQDASIDVMEKWAKKNDVKIVRVAMPYEIYLEKVTATLSSGSDQFDIVWHNDDWGQLWKSWVETTDDLPGMKDVFKRTVDVAFLNDEKRPTVVPMSHTPPAFFYRTDLVKKEELPKTWDELVAVSKKLQAEKKVKWGYVGGMVFNHSWYTWFWAMWSNNCDVFEPVYERDSAVLAKNGWKPMLDQPCMKQVVEYWWDAINTHKISPPGMPAYTRNDAIAIFQAGDAAFMLIDSTLFGTFNDPAKSKVAGKVWITPIPIGPGRTESWAWNDIWGWGIPKGAPAAKKKVAKEMLNAMLVDLDGQADIWKTGGPPPNTTIWPVLAEKDPFFRELKADVFDVKTVIAGAYYTPKWPAVHKAYSDAVIEAINGKREDIAGVLKKHAPMIHAAATE